MVNQRKIQHDPFAAAEIAKRLIDRFQVGQRLRRRRRSDDPLGLFKNLSAAENPRQTPQRLAGVMVSRIVFL